MLYYSIGYAELRNKLNGCNLPLIGDEDALCYIAEEGMEIVGYCVAASYMDGSYLLRAIKFFGERERLVREYALLLRHVYEDLNLKKISLKMTNTSFRKCKPYSVIVENAGLCLKPTGSYHFDIEKKSWEKTLEIFQKFLQWDERYFYRSFSSLTSQDCEKIMAVNSILPAYLQASRGFEDGLRDISVCAFDTFGSICGWGIAYIKDDYLGCYNLYCVPEFRKDCIGLFMCVSMAELSRKIKRYDDFSRISFETDVENIESYSLFFRITEKSDSKVFLISDIVEG